MKRVILLLLLVCSSLVVLSQTKYKLPPKEVIDILDAPPTPVVSISPRGGDIRLRARPLQGARP